MEKMNGLSSKENIKKQQRILYPAEMSTQSFGKLQVNVTSQSTNRPVTNAVINITQTGDPNNVIEQLTTDSSGQSQTIELPAPWSRRPHNHIRIILL